MDGFTSDDGTTLSVVRWGQGPPVVVVPGGPGRDAAYLEGLGGLAGAAERSVVVLEPRGTGGSPGSSDPAAYSVARTAADVEALRRHLGIGQMELLAHSAGCEVALTYTALHPERVRRLLLVTPSTRSLGIEESEESFEDRIRRRRAEPWFETARAALEETQTMGASTERRLAMSPFLYGRWDEAAAAHAATDASQRHPDVGGAFWSSLPDPASTHAALSAFTGAVRILIGDLDLAPGPEVAAKVAAICADVAVATQSGAAHFPWVDDAAAFSRTMATFLTGPP
ncbi:alpha/beta fold hydrolase [Luteimicrobium sp. NPDC057192]|uniref:alpha/beta fold hydrolase n=1 Tax=Luteimicrobium sp. NPDC057192 TaxID=3346042 RepID=UPI003645C653